ncbi:MAG: RnfABCDGE type electron transport complex subunit G [Verrucomicrobiota bacterium]
MKDIIKMVVVLTAISVVAGYLLATTNKITKAPIAAARLAEKMDAMKKVLPDYDNNPAVNTCVVQEAGKQWTFYVARRQGVFAGAAFEAASDQGYSGTIRILAGILPDNSIKGLEIIEQTETPGLGAKISESAFKDQFQGKAISHTRWMVKKDGGDIDAITGATISPRAVISALTTGLAVYTNHFDRIAATDGR